MIVSVAEFNQTRIFNRQAFLLRKDEKEWEWIFTEGYLGCHSMTGGIKTDDFLQINDI